MAAITASMVGRTARQDRRADDGVQEGADRGRRRHGQGRGDPARQARQQGRQGRRRASPPKAWSPRRSTAAPARWSKSTAKPTSSPRTTASWPSPRPLRRAGRQEQPGRRRRAVGAAAHARTASARRVEDVRKGLIGKIGENMSIRRFKRYAGGGKLASYLHGTRIGVLVEFEGDDAAAKDVAMHVAAMKPVALSQRRRAGRADREGALGRDRQGRRGRASAEAAGKPVQSPRSSPRRSKARCRST